MDRDEILRTKEQALADAHYARTPEIRREQMAIAALCDLALQRGEWDPVTAHEDWELAGQAARRACVYAWMAGCCFGAIAVLFVWLVF